MRNRLNFIIFVVSSLLTIAVLISTAVKVKRVTAEIKGGKMTREFIMAFEGCRLTAYPDSGGIYTIGYGHTKGVKRGDKITLEQADKFLDEDIDVARKRIPIAIPLTEYEFAACISLAFNLTLPSFKKLMSHLAKDKELFKSKMLLYCKDVRGNYLAGLLKRRICERMLFENRDWRDALKRLEGRSTKEMLEVQKQLFGG